jgi:transcriptional/translational regulatory protein YebC/TACO1
VPVFTASGQGAESYDIVVYEGYAPHGIAIMVETATNNVTRTVANVRSAFKTYGGSIGTEGSVAFQFKRMGVFRVAPEALAGKDLEALELDLIDHGLEEIAIVSADSEYVAQNLIALPEDKSTEVLELVDALEQDDDVQRVFHNLR